MIKELRKLEKAGLITLRPHDELPLLIANYTPEVQYGRLWDEHELLRECRGLIIDEEGNVIARPFPKFFNIEEHEEFDSLADVPYGERHKIYDKLDGSLGIVYWYKDKWRISTRGSFHSEQADIARLMLQTYDIEKLDKDYTYLVEIIYPQNRIVVNYGDKKELILIAKIHTETGEEPVDLSSLDESDVFPIVEEAPFNLHSLKKYRNELGDIDGHEKEGFVIHFESGLRIKVKLDDYVRLHRLMTGLTKRKVWELLKDGEDIEELYKTAPDEVYSWITNVAEELREEYRQYHLSCKMIYAGILCSMSKAGVDFDNRKEFALRVKKGLKDKNLNVSSILFKMKDGKDYEEQIWKLIKPEHEPLNTQEYV